MLSGDEEAGEEGTEKSEKDRKTETERVGTFDVRLGRIAFWLTMDIGSGVHKDG